MIRSGLSFGVSLGVLWGAFQPLFCKTLAGCWTGDPAALIQHSWGGREQGGRGQEPKGDKFCVKSRCRSSQPAGWMWPLLSQAGQLLSITSVPPEAETIAIIPHHIA